LRGRSLVGPGRIGCGRRPQIRQLPNGIKQVREGAVVAYGSSPLPDQGFGIEVVQRRPRAVARIAVHLVRAMLGDRAPNDDLHDDIVDVGGPLCPDALNACIEAIARGVALC